MEGISPLHFGLSNPNIIRFPNQIAMFAGWRFAQPDGENQILPKDPNNHIIILRERIYGNRILRPAPSNIKASDSSIHMKNIVLSHD